MPRPNQHVTETKTRIIFEEAVTSYASPSLHINEGGLMFRELSEKDYGVDGELEIFEDNEVTGKLARIQLKGTDKIIEKLKTVEFVSCQGISKSSLGYCRTNNIPFILVYISKANKQFYYCDLQPVFQDILQKMGDGKSVTIRIPVENNSENLEILVRIINSYYEDKSIKKIGAHRKGTVVDDMSETPLIDIQNDIGDDEVNHDNLWDSPYDVTSYVVDDYRTPSDGEHRMVDGQGNTVKIGYWKDGELDKGTEYNHLIRVTKGKLIFKPGCPDDPYDATDDFEYEKLEMYHWEPLSPFHFSEYSIAEVGMDNCYVVDMEVDGNMERMVNIRTLEEFLASKDPRRLKAFKKMIDLDREDVLEAGTEMNAENHKDTPQVIEAVLRERNAKLVTSNGSVTDVNYKALDLLKLFMESNYGKSDVVAIAEALSKIVLENKPDKDVYWKYATVANAVPGMIEEKEIRELVNILRAYKLIDCDRDGLFYVTDEGKRVKDETIIALDAAKG